MHALQTVRQTTERRQTSVPTVSAVGQQCLRLFGSSVKDAGIEFLTSLFQSFLGRVRLQVSAMPPASVSGVFRQMSLERHPVGKTI